MGGSKITLKGEVVLECIKRFPRTPTLTLARKIYNENIELFMSVEYVRTLIRYYRGSLGKRDRKYKRQKYGKSI